MLCGKGSAGIMTHTSPSRLRKPMKRVGPRGSGEFAEIKWDEALETATGWLKDVRGRDPSKLAFFTGRDQSQALTGWLAQQFGTQNFAAHGGFCSVNMAAAGLYTFGGSFWEFGEPDWEHTKYFMLFGVAEDHASNPLKIELGKLKQQGVKVVAVNPIRTGYGAIADEWIGIRPGTDGLFVGALIHELMRAQKIDLDYLVRYTNAHWLVIDDPQCRRRRIVRARCATASRSRSTRPPARSSMLRAPTFRRRWSAPSSCATAGTARPSFALIAERFLERRIQPGEGRGGDRDPGRNDPPHRARTGACRVRAAGHARRAVDRQGRPPPRQDRRAAGVDARHARHLGAFQRLPDLPDAAPAANPARLDRLPRRLPLQGAVPAPDAAAEPARRGRAEPNTPLKGAPLGFPQGPEDLLVDADGKPQRIDKAYSWDAPLAAHGLMHMVITNAATADPIRSTCCSCTWPT